MPSGRTILVGERGPELFVPPSAGVIIPNHALAGGGSGATVNFNGPVTIQAQDERQARHSAETMAWGLSAALRARGVA